MIAYADVDPNSGPDDPPEVRFADAFKTHPHMATTPKANAAKVIQWSNYATEREISCQLGFHEETDRYCIFLKDATEAVYCKIFIS